MKRKRNNRRRQKRARPAWQTEVESLRAELRRWQTADMVVHENLKTWLERLEAYRLAAWDMLLVMWREAEARRHGEALRHPDEIQTPLENAAFFAWLACDLKHGERIRQEMERRRNGK